MTRRFGLIFVLLAVVAPPAAVAAVAASRCCCRSCRGFVALLAAQPAAKPPEPSRSGAATELPPLSRCQAATVAVSCMACNVFLVYLCFVASCDHLATFVSVPLGAEKTQPTLNECALMDSTL